MKKNQKPQEDNHKSTDYNAFKEFQGQKYTGMQVGRTHTWNYDAGAWKEKKITPDLWEFNYNVSKHRKGHAPEGSGVPLDTEYHWYIVAHQNVRKLDANTYSTAMRGYKYKVAHKRADKDSWNVGYKGQRKRLIKFFQTLLKQLEKEEAEEAHEPKRKSSVKTAHNK